MVIAGHQFDKYTETLIDQNMCTDMCTCYHADRTDFENPNDDPEKVD